MIISLQLYSIKEEVEKDFDNALGMTKKAGYQGVEFAGYHGKTPDELVEMLAKHGLKAVSSHTPMERLRNSLDEEFNYAKKLGHNMIVCPYLDWKTEEAIIEDAKFLETCAQKAAAEGITIGYHNHAHEFKYFGEKYAMDILFDNMPSVKFEPDVFWIAHADVDPITYLKPFAASGRICAIHAKEISKEGKTNVYIGEGRIDFSGLADLCPPSEYYYIAEQEAFTTDYFDGISRCYQGLISQLKK